MCELNRRGFLAALFASAGLQRRSNADPLLAEIVRITEELFTRTNALKPMLSAAKLRKLGRSVGAR